MIVFKQKELKKYLLKNFDEKFEKTFRRLFFVEADIKSLKQKCKLPSIYSPTLSIFHRKNSKIDGSTKIILKTNDNQLIEMVILRIATGRTTLCVSSQIGCTEKCIFCATGQSGFQRNLTSEEICNQVFIARQILTKEKRHLRNLVFMGMGEPLRNYDNLISALKLLTSPKHFAFSPNHITVSTLGVVEKMIPLIKNFPKIQLALSLNSSNDLDRSKIMPINSKWNLTQLKKTIITLNQHYDKEVFIEYIMFKGNDSPKNAHQLIKLLDNTKVKINLIPYNETNTCNLTSSDKQSIQNFKTLLQNANFRVTCRYSLGQDIKAACGQLAKQMKQTTKK